MARRDASSIPTDVRAASYDSAVESLRRLVGQFWLPENPDRTVGGVLDIRPDTALELELTDQLLPGGLEARPAPIVHGHADGRPVTLLECMPANGGKTVIAQVMTTTQVTRPRIALIGVHLDDPCDAAFDGLEVAMTGLTTWAANSGMRAQYVAIQQSNERVRATMSWVEPVELTLQEPADWTLCLRWRLITNGPTSDLVSRTFRAEENVVLRIEVPRPQAWDAFNSMEVAVRDLVTIATQTPCRITERTLLMKSEDPQGRYTVDLYYRTAGRPSQQAAKFRESDMIFSLRDIDFATVIERWLPLRDKLGLPLDVLLGLDYQEGGYYENRLFNAASAAEGFHAALCPDTSAIPADAYAAAKKQISDALAGLRPGLLRKVTPIVEALSGDEQKKVLGLLGGVDKAQREWAMSKLGDNRPGLKARYLELATKADEEAVTALLTDVDTWAKWLRNARNAIGHLNTGELATQVPDENARYRLVYITRALLHLILLSELGVDAETQRRLVNDEWGYSAEHFGDAVRNTSSQ